LPWDFFVSINENQLIGSVKSKCGQEAFCGVLWGCHPHKQGLERVDVRRIPS